MEPAAEMATAPPLAPLKARQTKARRPTKTSKKESSQEATLTPQDIMTRFENEAEPFMHPIPEDREEEVEREEAKSAIPDLSEVTVAICGPGISIKDLMADAIAAGGIKGLADEIWTCDALGGILYSHRKFVMSSVAAILKDTRLHVMSEWISDEADPAVIYSCDAAGETGWVQRYPVEEVLGHLNVAYLNSSAAYALALALAGRAKRIKIYGLDFTGRQRANIEFLLAKAIHSGISLELCPSTTLLDNDVPLEARLYGFSSLPDPCVVVTEDGKLTVKAKSSLQTARDVQTAA